MSEMILADRIRHALREHVGPALELNGAGLEVVAVADGIVTVRLGSVCTSCPATIGTLLTAIEAELRRHVPEVEFLEAVP